ncbi:MAG: Tm-1-like ATP-binding domain-containing protein, partial [Deltaproteobacteria bacterium]
MMEAKGRVVILGTFDSKAEELSFVKERIEKRGPQTLTINVGTRRLPSVSVDVDLFGRISRNGEPLHKDRDTAINAMIQEARVFIRKLHQEGKVDGIISAGGGSGTHICSTIMRELPLGVPKIMVSTVASRNMADIVSTKDIVMMHSVVDLLGVNSISGRILAGAAAAMCGMLQDRWQPVAEKKRIALSFFGFITPGAEAARRALESRGYEVVAFHANGTGGMAMEELAAEGYFSGILDFATHELADRLKSGYCGAIGPQRYEPVPGRNIPRLVVPGGLDCAVLEFTRQTVPMQFRDRKIFFYDFRSAIRLNHEETTVLARQLSEKLNRASTRVRVLIPNKGWSEADREGGPLHETETNALFVNQ